MLVHPAVGRRHGVKGPVAVASTIVSAIVGAVTLAQMAVEPDVAQGILDGARDTVRTLLSRTNPVQLIG